MNHDWQSEHHPPYARHLVALASALGAAFLALAAYQVYLRAGAPGPPFGPPPPDGAENPKAEKPAGGARKKGQPPEQPGPPPAPGALDLKTVCADVPDPYRSFLLRRKAWLTAQESAEFVYLPGRRRWMVVAVGSSELSKDNPKIACKLRALAAVVAARKAVRLESVEELHGKGAAQSIKARLEGEVVGMPVVGEWLSADGKSVSVLYGSLLDP